MEGLEKREEEGEETECSRVATEEGGEGRMGVREADAAPSREISEGKELKGERDARERREGSGEGRERSERREGGIEGDGEEREPEKESESVRELGL